MSTGESSAPPPGTGPAADKTQAAKPAATFSSFINKNTTGKKFAPKAARRRPAASAAAATKPASTPATADAQAQTSIAEPEPSTTPAVHHVTPQQLPTPAPTQEPAAQPAAQPVPSTIEAIPSTALPCTTEKPNSAEAVVVPTTAPADLEPQSTENQVEQRTNIIETNASEEAPAGRAAKRRRIEPQESASVPRSVLETREPEAEDTAAHGVENVSTEPPPEASAATQQKEAVPNVEDDIAEEASVPEPSTGEATVPRSRGRRVLPWVAVNQPQVEDGEVAATTTKKRIRQPPKPRRRKSAIAETVEGDILPDADAEDAQGDPSQPPTARAKRKVRPMDGDNAEAPPTAKRTRRPRQAKTRSTIQGETGEGEGDEQGEASAEAAVGRQPRKPRQPRRKKQASQGEGNGVDGEGGTAQPKRKGRPPREPTPEDAENHTIDPEVTFMDSLATRNIRVGKLSTREQEMRKIDWAAVRQRQREEDARPIESRDEREARERLMAEEMQTTEAGPQYRVVDGKIELVSTALDRAADADREIELYETVEERDLTTRITSRSFMKNNKRWPNEFVLPGQGKRWTTDDTALFYQGLRSFGTDFQMISRMFPGSTRRAIKTKFTREEREHPDDVREALLGKSELTQHWDTFLKASQMEEESFADADEIKRQLAEEEAEMRERIAAATAETLERKRQQKEAGLLDDDAEGNEASNKENGKGKKKRKGKEKQVAFEDEAGVEILGGIDDDANWGQE